MKVLAERRDIVLVECKRTNSRPIGVKTIRELNGLLDHERSVRGVIVTTTKFTRGARKFVRDNSRLNLVDGDALVLMMNEHLGWDWPRRADLLVRLALQNNDGHDSVPDQRLDR
jgi:restriction system protein